MDHRQCLFCGATLDPGVEVSRTMIKGHVQVAVVEYPCPKCAEGTEIALPRPIEFCDRAADLLGDKARKRAERPSYEAVLDDDQGWIFARV